MHLRITAAAILAASLPLQAVTAQGTINVPVGGTGGKAVPHNPPADPKDTPEEIAKDAARDLKDSRLYNKPGATRAQYDADWQECRLIARGSRTPAGTVPVYYNPAIVSPVAAGAGGLLGGLIANAIIEGQQRRANRRACLLIKGWRLVDLSAAETKRISAMTDAQRSGYFNTVVGAQQVSGKITERASFTQPADLAPKIAAPVPGPGTLFLGKKIDVAAPVKLEPGQGAVVFAFRRPDAASAGRHGALLLSRYDMQGRDALYQPRDWKKKGDKTTYAAALASSDKKVPLEVQVLRLTEGDYVISSSAIGKLAGMNSYCFGAPTFRVNPGEVVYLGDFIPYINAPLSDGTKFTGLAYASHLEDARRLLAVKQPQLASAMKAATLRNGATFACSAMQMDRWDLPGVEMLSEPAGEAEAAAEVASNS